MFRCGSLEQTTSRKSSFTCSFLFLMFCKNLVERRHGQLYHPTIYLSFPLCLSFSLSLSFSQLCQTTVSIAVCLPSSKNHLAENLRHTHSHMNTYTFLPGSNVVQKVIMLVLCRLLFNGNIYSSKKYQNFTTMVQTGWVRLLNCKNPVLPQGLSSSEQTSPCAARKYWASTPMLGNHEIDQAHIIIPSTVTQYWGCNQCVLCLRIAFRHRFP